MEFREKGLALFKSVSDILIRVLEAIEVTDSGYIDIPSSVERFDSCEGIFLVFFFDCKSVGLVSPRSITGLTPARAVSEKVSFFGFRRKFDEKLVRQYWISPSRILTSHTSCYHLWTIKILEGRIQY